MKSLFHAIFTLLLPVAASFAHAATPYFTSNLDQAREVFLAVNGSNRYLAGDLVNLLSRKNRGLPQNQMVRLTLFVSPENQAEVDALINAETTQFLSKKVTEGLGDDVGGSTDWLQDAGEFFFDSKGRPSFLKHSASAQFDLGTFVSQERGVSLTTVKGQPQEDSSIEGGNIETTPGGAVYVGEDLDPKFLSTLKDLVGKTNVVTIDTSSSNVGHVDESFQYVPADADKSNGCGYALAYTDYLDGLRIALAFGLYGSADSAREGSDRQVTKAEYLESISYFTGVKTENIELTLPYFIQLIEKFDLEKPLRAFDSLYGFRKEDIYVQKAFASQKKLLVGLNKLRARSAKEGCANLKVIPLPSLWTIGFNSDVTFPETQDIITDERTSSLTAFTNFVVINDAILIPDAKVPSQLLAMHSEEEFERIGAKFKEIIGQRFTAIGFKSEDVIFTNVAGSILGDGAAHCKSNVLRAK